MIWLYAITDQPDAQLPAMAGHNARALEQTSANGLAGVWSAGCSHPSAGDTTAASLWRQEAVLEALMRDRTVLPLRYGTVLDDVCALQQMIERQHGQWSDAVRAVHGCCEMAVRAASRSRAVPTAHVSETGTQYLMRRTQEQSDARAVGAWLDQALEHLFRAKTVSTPKPPHLNVSYLVPRDSVEPFRAAITQLAKSRPELAVACTGPWPPYSFVQPTGGET